MVIFHHESLICFKKRMHTNFVQNIYLYSPTQKFKLIVSSPNFSPPPSIEKENEGVALSREKEKMRATFQSVLGTHVLSSLIFKRIL
jgi:hypothetical protein